MASESHDHENESELTECPECGAEIRGRESLESQAVPELRIGERSVYSRGNKDLWLCKGCRATLGVSLGER